jgi:hypothetical protein
LLTVGQAYDILLMFKALWISLPEDWSSIRQGFLALAAVLWQFAEPLPLAAVGRRPAIRVPIDLELSTS